MNVLYMLYYGAYLIIFEAFLLELHRPCMLYAVHARMQKRTKMHFFEKVKFLVLNSFLLTFFALSIYCTLFDNF